MRYVWFTLWLAEMAFFAIFFRFVFLIDNPLAMIFGWIYMIGILSFMVPIGYHAIKGLRK